MDSPSLVLNSKICKNSKCHKNKHVQYGVSHTEGPYNIELTTPAALNMLRRKFHQSTK